jgi:4,5-DOPA dioxygenase extradiol
MTAPIFLSHGAPDLYLRDEAPAHRFLRALGPQLKARAAVVISAHWEAGPIRVTASPRPATIHDFRGFGPELDAFDYPVDGDPALAAKVLAHLEAAGLEAVADPRRGLDHGVWIPFALMRPQADMPIVQVSLPARSASDADVVALGRALVPLAQEEVQLIGSGSLTHSLRDSLGASELAPPAGFAEAFRDWADARIAAFDLDGLLDRASDPEAGRNHPTPEHFRPLLAVMAAAQGSTPERLHASWSRAALAMDVWRFG